MRLLPLVLSLLLATTVGCSSKEDPSGSADASCPVYDLGGFRDLSSPPSPPDLAPVKVCTTVPEWDNDKETKTPSPACAALMVEEIAWREYRRTDPVWVEPLSVYVWASDATMDLTSFTLGSFPVVLEFTIRGTPWRPGDLYYQVDDQPPKKATFAAGGGSGNYVRMETDFSRDLQLQLLPGERNKHRLSLLFPRSDLPVRMPGDPTSDLIFTKTGPGWKWQEPDGTAHITYQNPAAATTRY